jgi:hypothetical protein
MFLPRETAGQHDRHIRQRTAPSLFDVVADRRLASVRNADGIELKFNPWHDPENGRFTFASAGHRYAGASGKSGGGGAAGSGDLPARPPQPKPQSPAGRATPKDPTRSTAPADSAASSAAAAPGTWAGGGFREVEAVAPVERELQEPGNRQSRNFVRGLPAVRQQPSFLRADLWRQARPPRHLQARRASNFARLFATAISTR